MLKRKSESRPIDEEILLYYNSVLVPIGDDNYSIGEWSPIKAHSFKEPILLIDGPNKVQILR